MEFYKQLFYAIHKFVIFFFIFIIFVYQVLISPFLGSNCRFYPSCSKYALGVIKLHGLILGIILTLKRLLKCNPWGCSGYDPIPEKKDL